MHCVQKLTNDVFWVGVNDRKLERFENIFPVPKGVSYNSYMILDEKTALVDTVDSSCRDQFIENVKYLLDGKKLDYLIVNHIEPDHCGSIIEILNMYPEVKLVGNKKTFLFFEQFYHKPAKENYLEVKEGDTLDLGEHQLQFYAMPMVHWPEVMITFDTKDKILFSADAFGTFGTINGNLFADQTDYEGYYLSETRRYYANIVSKYGLQVQSTLKKLSLLDIKMIASLHGLVWRKNLDYIIDLYDKWSSFTPEKQGVVIAFASMYGNTENIVDCLANRLSEKGVEDIRVFDVSKTHPSYIISEILKYSNVVFASPTYNLGLYMNMETLLHDVKALNFQKRNISLIGNYTWASAALKVMAGIVEELKNVNIVGSLEILTSLDKSQENILNDLADEIIQSLKQK